MSVRREGGLLLTVTETGYGRLSELDDYRIQSRGGKGLINYHTDEYGDVAGIKVVDPDDDVILISSEGIIIRMQVSEIRLCRRPSKGVRVMRVEEGDRIVSLARMPHEEEPEGETTAAGEASSAESAAVSASDAADESLPKEETPSES